MAAADRVICSSLPVDGPKHEGEAEWRSRRVEPLSHQVAGHKYGIDKVGILQDSDGTVLKQLQPHPRGPCELHFYTQVFSQDCRDPQLLALQQHLPKYHGTWTSTEKPNELYLKLEDVTRRFTHPCIMDVKIGRKSYDPLASQQKREEQIRKYPLMEEIGFLILGMRVYQVSPKSYISHDQYYGRSLTKETLETGLTQFFHNGEELRRDAISLSIHKIRNILCWFEGQKQLHFYASSLLFVYEGAPLLGNASRSCKTQTALNHRQAETQRNNFINYANSSFEDLNCSFTSQSSSCGKVNSSFLIQDINLETFSSRRDDAGREEDVEVRMIDFAHVFPSDSPDECYIYGLRSLLTILEQILHD